jgi:hypothetical protein
LKYWIFVGAGLFILATIVDEYLMARSGLGFWVTFTLYKVFRVQGLFKGSAAFVRARYRYQFRFRLQPNRHRKLYGSGE